MKRLGIGGLLLIFLSACIEIPGINPDGLNPYGPIRNEKDYSDLPDLGVAPEFENEIWLNVDKPLKLGDLRGNVVLLVMWTFG